MSIYKNGKLIAGGRQCMPLLSFMWADHQLNDVSWLRADTFSWHTGNKTTGVYPAAYKHLYEETRCWGWYNPNLTPDIGYTRGLTVAVGDPVYSNNTLSTQIGTVSAVDLTSTPKTITFNGNTYPLYIEDNIASTTETVAGITITYFPAPDGHKICLANQESAVAAIYAATGVAWYYIIDTANQRFKLPRTKFGFTGLRDTVGNYIAPGLPDHNHTISSTFSLQNYSAANPGAWDFIRPAAGNTITPTTNASDSNSIYGKSTTVQPPATQMYLYFYIGQFTQTALENTAGITAETLNDKVDVGHQVVEFQEPTSANNYTWYRKYADGWLEQGGNYTATSPIVVTLMVEMANTEYAIMTSSHTGRSGGSYSKTTTGFSIPNCPGLTTDQAGSWQVSGMAA